MNFADTMLEMYQRVEECKAAVEAAEKVVSTAKSQLKKAEAAVFSAIRDERDARKPNLFNLPPDPERVLPPDNELSLPPDVVAAAEVDQLDMMVETVWGPSVACDKLRAAGIITVGQVIARRNSGLHLTSIAGIGPALAKRMDAELDAYMAANGIEA